MKKMNMAAVVVLAAAALSTMSHAAQVTVSGTYNLGTVSPIGTTGPLGINDFVSQDFLAGEWGGANSLSGRVTATNERVGNGQRLRLELDAFRWSNTGYGPLSLTVIAVQDFVAEAGSSLGSWTQHLAGQAEFAGGNQSASAIVSSCTDGINLPEVSWAGNSSRAQTVPFSRSSIVEMTQGVQSVFRIVTCFQFTLSPDCNAATVGVGCGGSEVGLIVTPVPPAGLAGLGGMACAAMVVAKRRRTHTGG